MLVGGCLVVSPRRVAMMLGGILMRLALSVARQNGGLLMSGGRAKVCAARVEMSFSGRMVGVTGPLERLGGSQPRPFDRLRCGWHAAGQLGAPLPQLAGTGTGPGGP